MTVDALEGQVATLCGALERLDTILDRAGYGREGAYRTIIGDALKDVEWEDKPTPDKEVANATLKDSPYTFHVSAERDSGDGTWQFVAWEHDETDDMCATGRGDTVYAAIANLCHKLDKEDDDESGRP